MHFMITAPDLRVAWPMIGEAIRSLAGVLVVVLAALWWGSAPTAMAVGGAAAIAGSVALQDNPNGRVRMTVVVSFAAGLAVLIGWLTVADDGRFIAAVTLWCMAAGMCWAVSASTGLVAATVSILVLIAPQVPGTTLSAPVTATMALLAALLQVVLVAAWPTRWRQHQHDALTRAYQTIADNARDLAADPQISLDVDPLITLRESFAPTERQARRRPPAHRGLFALPERIALTLDTLRTAAAAPGIRAALLSTADVLCALADQTSGDVTEIKARLDRLDEAVVIVPASTAETAGRLQAQVHEAAQLHFVTAPRLGELARRMREMVVRQLNWNSPVFRHGIRLAAAVGVATALSRFTTMEYAIWIPLTVLMVLRPETAHTYTRCLARVAAITLGVALATTLTVFWSPGGVVMAVLAVLLLAVVHAVSGIGYIPLSAALAAAIVFLLDIGGSPSGGALGERVAATLIGGLLAVASHVVFPDRSLIRLRQRAGELLKAESDYAAVIISAFVHHLDDPDTAVTAAWHRALRARSAFEATSGSARTDVPAVRRWLSGYRMTLNAVTGACATLETHVPGNPPPNLDRRFVVAVDDYVDALRGDVPSPGQAWAVDAVHLAEADQQLRDSASLLGREHSAQRLLISEVETITRQLVSTAPRGT